MTIFGKNEYFKYFIGGSTHEDAEKSDGVGYAIKAGLFNLETDGWLSGIDVWPDLRHKGLGKSLVEEFHQHCKDLGLTRVLCIVASNENRQEDLKLWYRDVLGYDLVEADIDDKHLTFGIKQL